MNIDLRPFDKEIQALAADINALKASEESEKSPEQRRLDLLQAQVVRSHGEFMAAMEGLNDLQRRHEHLEGRAGTLNYWLKILTQKIYELYEHRVRSLRKSLWSEIISGRLPLSAGGGLSDSGLMANGRAVQSAHREEFQLQSRLKTLLAQEQKLQFEVGQMETAEANWQACGSLRTDFGSAEDAWEHPILAGLGEYLKRATVPIRLGASESDLAEIEMSLMRETQGLLARSRAYVMEKIVRKGASSGNRPSSESFRMLESLRHQVSDRVLEAYRAMPPDLHPTIFSGSSATSSDGSSALPDSSPLSY